MQRNEINQRRGKWFISSYGLSQVQHLALTLIKPLSDLNRNLMLSTNQTEHFLALPFCISEGWCPHLMTGGFLLIVVSDNFMHIWAEVSSTIHILPFNPIYV